jgi:hypothetical protein
MSFLLLIEFIIYTIKQFSCIFCEKLEEIQTHNLQTHDNFDTFALNL